MKSEINLDMQILILSKLLYGFFFLIYVHITFSEIQTVQMKINLEKVFIIQNSKSFV